jgi:hypothetical protein
MSNTGTFGNPTFNNDVGFKLDPSDDKQAFTASFSGLIVSINDAGAAPIVAKEFSFAVPLSGVDSGTQIPFAVSGFAGVEKGANAHLIFIVNDQMMTATFQENPRGDYVKQFSFKSDSASELRITLVLVANRDSTSNAGATLNVLSIDTDLNKRQTSPRGPAGAPR